MKGSNSKNAKLKNRALVVKMIQQNGLITRADIAKKTGLTRAAITTITNSLISEGLVKEEADPSVNKKSIPLAINNDYHRTLALSLGRSSTVGALLDLSGNILYTEEIPHGEAGLKKYMILDNLLLIIANITKVCHLDTRQIIGIGVAGPGPISMQDQSMSESEDQSELPPYRWGEFDMKSVLEQNLGLPVFLENNCNVSALGERWYGAGRGVDKFAVYSVGIGVGAGVVLDGEMRSGKGDVFGEVGHITVDLNGPECSCGNRGCLEIYGSFKALVDKYLLAMGYDSGVSTDAQYLRNIESVFQKAADGDEVCRDLVEKQGEILSIGAVSLANMFSPDRIIITSNEIGDTDYSMIVPVIDRLVKKRAFKVIADKVEIIKSPLGKDVDLYGGAALVLENFLEKDLPRISQ